MYARSEDATHLAALYRAIHAVVRRIPRGRISTYGVVAEIAGVPRGARIAAAALKTSRPEDGLPWWRVLGKRGPTTARIAIHDPVGAAMQRALLTKEKIEVDDRGLVSLATFGWASEAPPKRRAAARIAKPALAKPMGRAAAKRRSR
ncbi:MAG: MGMT family protein [Deltaproteobacteria bacterium]|nr:MGMT family protein [Deltaproteobacteria bacterium]